MKEVEKGWNRKKEVEIIIRRRAGRLYLTVKALAEEAHSPSLASMEGQMACAEGQGAQEATEDLLLPNHPHHHSSSEVAQDQDPAFLRC